jgi:hypothetical protein
MLGWLVSLMLAAVGVTLRIDGGGPRQQNAGQKHDPLIAFCPRHMVS